MVPRHRLFARMWGVAVIAHLAGNWRYGDLFPRPTAVGFFLAVAGVLGTAVVVSPRRSLLLALGAIVPITAALETPILPNHWLLAAFVSLAYLLTRGGWERFETAARLILLTFYSFAAFAKLNSGFLNPVTSCGLYYTNHLLGALGAPSIPAGGVAAWAAAVGSAAVELSVPVLLIARRTRPIGAMIAIAFHGLISLDLAQHFFDFTAVLLALLTLFLGDGYAERFELVGDRLRPRLRRLLAGAVVALGLLVTAANVTPMTGAVRFWLERAPFLAWVPYLGVVAWAAAGARERIALGWRPDAVGAVLGLLVFLNGLTPYFELKTAFGWNMYSNLVTLDGRSNHLIVRATLPLRDGHRQLVTIVASGDPTLQSYADEGYRMPWPSFRSYLASHPDASVVYERDGQRVEVPRPGDTGLSAPVPWWWRFMPLRSVNAADPARCQPSFGEAL